MKQVGKLKKGRFGSLFLIVVLLVGSATLRVALGTTQAIAKTKEHAEAKPASTPEKVRMAQADTTDTTALLDAIRAREKRVQEQELKQQLRAKSLDVAQHEIERRIEALEMAEKRLRATLAQADTAAEDDVARLTTVYENMKPKDAAALFEAMEPAFAAGFLGRMRPDAAAGIMAGLNPQAAYTISVILAGRNANAPKS